MSLNLDLRHDGSGTSTAAPAGEMFTTRQQIPDPSPVMKATSSISLRFALRRSCMGRAARISSLSDYLKEGECMDDLRSSEFAMVSLRKGAQANRNSATSEPE